MTVQLAMYKGKGKIGNATIRWWTDSEYSHCELAVDGICYSSSMMDGGVRSKRIDLEDGNWDLIDLPWVDPLTVIYYFHNTDIYEYSWFGLITSQVLNLNKEEKDKQFCSQWCANAIGLPNPSSYSPVTLAAVCIYLRTQYTK